MSWVGVYQSVPHMSRVLVAAKAVPFEWPGLSSLTDVATNLIVAFLAFVFGSAWRSVRRAIKLRDGRRFWAPFTSGEVRLVVGRFAMFNEFEPTGFVGGGDVNASAELRRFLNTLDLPDPTISYAHVNLNILGLPDPVISYADAIDGDQLKANLILLGGPDANKITGEVMDRISTGLRFGDPSQNEIVIRDVVTGKLYAPLRQKPSGKIRTDYGAIIRSPNPFDPSKHVLIVVGSFGYGTWAAMRYAMSREFLRTRVALSGKPLEALIETDVYADTPQGRRVVVLRPLKN